MSNKRILIVEDDGIIAARLQSTLIKLGYDALDTVPSGEKAIQRVGEVPPNLVLMDINLAGKLNGIETATQMRSQFDIPVVYLTAHSNNELLQRAKITEPYGYLVKPVTERRLHATLEIALYRHELEVERRRMEKTLRESELRYRTLFNSFRDAIITIGSDGKILSANPASAVMFRYDSPQELVGLPAIELYMDPEHRDIVFAKLMEKDYIEDIEIECVGWCTTLCHSFLYSSQR